MSLPVRMTLPSSLCNIRVMGSGTLRPVQAWSVLRRLVDDPRIVLIDQIPVTHAKFWYDNVARREPTPDLSTDAWLAALAQAAACRLVTLYRGVRSFRKLDLQLLRPVA